MKSLLISLSLALALLSTACKKDAPTPEGPATAQTTPPDQATPPQPATPADQPPPDQAGAPADQTGAQPDPRESSPGKPMVCKTDADCVVSCERKMECCDQLCPPCNQPFHKLDLDANDKWRGGHCAAVSCPMAKCKAPTEESYAVCQAGTCLVKKRPLKNP